MQLEGTVTAPESVRVWKFLDDRRKWIQFSDISGLVMKGGGQIDGQGAAWWNSNDVSNRPTVCSNAYIYSHRIQTKYN